MSKHNYFTVTEQHIIFACVLFPFTLSIFSSLSALTAVNESRYHCASFYPLTLSEDSKRLQIGYSELRSSHSRVEAEY